MKCGRNVKTLISVLIMITLVSASACSVRSKPVEALAPAPVPTDKVVVNVSSFDPPSVLVTTGTVITWTNRDEVSYLVAENGQRFAFNLPAGGSFSITFTDPGTYDYHCASHPDMQGTITVVPGVTVQMDTSGERSSESTALSNSRGNS
jgi:plastocyanin